MRRDPQHVRGAGWAAAGSTRLLDGGNHAGVRWPGDPALTLQTLTFWGAGHTDRVRAVYATIRAPMRPGGHSTVWFANDITIRNTVPIKGAFKLIDFDVARKFDGDFDASSYPSSAREQIKEYRS